MSRNVVHGFCFSVGFDSVVVERFHALLEDIDEILQRSDTKPDDA